VLPPNRFVGGGPAGVVEGLPKANPEGAGVVEPAGADVVVPPVERPPKSGLVSPGPELEAAPNRFLGGVCVPARLPKEGVLAPPPKGLSPPLGLLSAVAPFEGLLSPVFDGPKPEKFQAPPADLLASPPPKSVLPEVWPLLPPPKRVLPEGFDVPKRPDVDDELVEGAPKLNFGWSPDMAAIAFGLR
jgi:hypothetical protein